MPSPLVLASASPRRAELLRRAGRAFTVFPVDCDERWRPGEAPVDYVARVAADKARFAAHRWQELEGSPALLLAADTTVWLDADAAPLGKPEGRDEARAMLRELCAGRPHQVTTACAFARSGPDEPAIVDAFAETTRVYMRHLDGARFAAFIADYLEHAAWADKAGAYAIQGRAAAIVERIEGSYTAVVGLPLAQVLAHLEQLEQP